MINYNVLPCEQGSQEWHNLRKRGIGGSDAAAVLGLSKFRTPYEVWLDKTSAEIFEAPLTAPMEWGKIMEPIIRRYYADKMGCEIIDIGGIARSKDHPFMLHSPDGLRSDGRLIEIKKSRTSEGWGDSDSEEIPVDYMAQVQHGMAVFGADACDLAVLIGGDDFRVYTIYADRELQKMMIRAERDFWELVQNGECPEPVSPDDARSMYQKIKTDAVEATAESLAMVENLKKARHEKGKWEEEERRATLNLMREMGVNAAEAISHRGNFLCTWKTRKDGTRVFSLK